MPVEHDPLTQIVNVQWEGGGLAVEFHDKADGDDEEETA